MRDGGSSLSASAVVAVIGRPWLWTTAIRQVFRLAPNGWWRRTPFLPFPDRRYLGFRLETQYGESVQKAASQDVVTYLAWCRSYQRELRQRSTRV